jgi:hypothetical protein
VICTVSPRWLAQYNLSARPNNGRGIAVKVCHIRIDPS